MLLYWMLESMIYIICIVINLKHSEYRYLLTPNKNFGCLEVLLSFCKDPWMSIVGSFAPFVTMRSIEMHNKIQKDFLDLFEISILNSYNFCVFKPILVSTKIRFSNYYSNVITL